MGCSLNSFLFAVDDLPFGLDGMSTIEDPTDSSSLVVSGGYDRANRQLSASILKLTCASEEVCKWQVLSHKLKVPRQSHVSFFTNKSLNCTRNKTKDDTEDDTVEGTVDYETDYKTEDESDDYYHHY